MPESERIQVKFTTVKLDSKTYEFRAAWTGWQISSSGHIQGGFDTPIFEQCKKSYNSKITRINRDVKNKRYSINKKHKENN